MNKSSDVKIFSILLLFLFLSLAVSCGDGGGGGGSSSVESGTYEGRVSNYKAEYGKSDEWEDWMIANKARYEAAFAASSAKPATITISFRYQTTPIN